VDCSWNHLVTCSVLGRGFTGKHGSGKRAQRSASRPAARRGL
jgi:hypothetical protein